MLPLPPPQKRAHHVVQTEFEETILEDLHLLDVRGDQVTHTSDHFDKLYEYAIQIIKSGKAYADDTEQATVRCLNAQTSF